MGNSFGLRDPFYTDRTDHLQAYKNGPDGEHQIVINDEHFVQLDRGVLNGVSRGDQKALDYVMKQLTSADTTRDAMEKALLRVRNAELEMQLDGEIEDNIALRQK